MAGTVVVAALLAALGAVVQPLVAPVRSTPAVVDPARLQAHVKHLSVDLHPRSFDQPEKLAQAANYVLAQMRAVATDVQEQPVVVDGQSFKNVVVRFGPSTGPVLVLGAHYDSHGHAGDHTPGADDNASGVAGLIELARLLTLSPPKRRVELVAYTLEEPPHFRTEHMGSAWHARALAQRGEAVELMLALEMIGYFSDAPGSQDYPAPGMRYLYPEQGNFVALVGKLSDFGAMRRSKALMSGATDLPVFSVNAPTAIAGIDFSDHLNYWREGFPAIMVTDTAFMRNKNYHQAEDTYDKLDYQRMAKVVQGVYALVQGY